MISFLIKDSDTLIYIISQPTQQIVDTILGANFIITKNDDKEKNSYIKNNKFKKIIVLILNIIILPSLLVDFYRCLYKMLY